MPDYRTMYHAFGHKLLTLAKEKGELKAKVVHAELRVKRYEYVNSELLAAIRDVFDLVPIHAQWRCEEAIKRSREILYMYSDALIREKVAHDEGAKVHNG